MEPLQEWLGHIPRSVLIVIALAIAGMLIQRSLHSSRQGAAAMDEATFKARPLLLVAFAVLCLVFLWPVFFGLGQPPHHNHGLIIPVLLRLFLLGFAALFAFLVFTLRRSYIRITPRRLNTTMVGASGGAFHSVTSYRQKCDIRGPHSSLSVWTRETISIFPYLSIRELVY